MKPYENRTSCHFCKTKGYLKIVKNEDANEQIRNYLNKPKNVMYSFEIENKLRCFCQNCGSYGNYNINEGLFSDGVVKEI